MARARSRAWVRALPTAWALVLAIVLLGRALGPGYVLSYDMVWVPDLALQRDVLGLGSALPRAIPSDAVVAALDEVLGGMLLQKVVLLGTLVGAGAGFAALVRQRSVGAQLVAVTLGTWNPFVVERLAMGHWPVLIGYAVLPWLVVALGDLGQGPVGRGGERGGLRARVPLLLVLGSLSASAGLATALVALAVAGRARGRTTALLAACLVGANAPWVVAGLASPAATASDPIGARVFATGDEGAMPGPLAALSFGGIWNTEVVPGSRLGIAGVVFTVLLVLAALVGAVLVARGATVPHLGALVVCWCVGLGLAALSWAAPGALGWWGEHVPAGGLVRDGSRLLGLSVLLVVALVAVAVDGLLDRLPDPATVVLVGGVLAVLPVTLMPDVVWGLGGRLDAVSYPASYDRARAAVADAPPGDALSLPFVSYRAPAWNGGRRVLDPLGRYVGRPTVVNDALVVSGRTVRGEDPQSAAVASALDVAGAAGRTAALREAGISVAVAEDIEGYPVPELAGDTVDADGLTVVVLGDAEQRRATAGRTAVVLGGWVVWLMVLGVPVALLVRRRRPW